MGNAPLQPPDALQEVALVELHVNVESSPLLIVVRAALTDAVGTALTGDGLPPPPQAANNSAAPSARTGLKNRIASRSFQHLIHKIAFALANLS